MRSERGVDRDRDRERGASVESKEWTFNCWLWSVDKEKEKKEKKEVGGLLSKNPLSRDVRPSFFFSRLTTDDR